MLTRPPPDYRKAEIDGWRKNAQSVPIDLYQNNSGLLQKIATFAKKFGYKESEIREKIQSDEMFAAHFAKSPTRQVLHENLAAEWLKTTPGIENFEKLPASRKNGVFVTTDGEIRKGKDGAPGKSLDFRWTTKERTFLASHKYTRESGGSQDQQFNEMRDLLRRFLNCRQRNHVLMVIVDGAYYTVSKMHDLRNITRTHDPLSFAVHIEQVPGILDQL